ncbi:hypothetical protein [Thermosinus carboxydivorans]|nr:hypothetical protein [Thermosinus carboxydivorans]
MWWGHPMWGGWGMPLGMFLFSVFFLVCLGFMFYFFSRGGFPFGHGRDQVHSDVTNRELLEEVRKLRQEVEELKKEKK